MPTLVTDRTLRLRFGTSLLPIASLSLCGGRCLAQGLAHTGLSTCCLFAACPCGFHRFHRDYMKRKGKAQKSLNLLRRVFDTSKNATEVSSIMIILSKQCRASENATGVSSIMIMVSKQCATCKLKEATQQNMKHGFSE